MISTLFTTILNIDIVWFIIISVVIAIIVILLAIFMLVNKKKTQKAKMISKVVDSPSEWLTALGGKENIKEVSALGSRLTIKLNDQSLVNKEAIKALGVENIIEMSDKIILVVENQAEEILKQIQ